MESMLTNDILTLLRRIGDPLVDNAAARVDAPIRKRLMTEASATAKALVPFRDEGWLDGNASAYGLADFLKPAGTLPDQGLVKTACDLFARYGSEIAAALLLAALPEAYAAGEGSKVLAQRSQLIKGEAPFTRRILATAQFVVWVLTPGPLAPPVSVDPKTQKYRYALQSYDATKQLWGAPSGQALRASLALRIMHSLIRTNPPAGIKIPGAVDPGDVPLNQEDLLATLLSFTITVFEVLERFGITWTAEEQEAYFYVWDHVGRTLGIGDEHVIGALTGSSSLEKLRQKLSIYDETGRLPRNDLAASAGVVGRVTRKDVEPLFKDQLNRRVLRRIADVGTLRPQSVPEARALLARLRERMWTLTNDRPPTPEPFPYENFEEVLNDVSAGRMLLRAMVDEVADRLPASQKTWPIAVIRQLVPPPVQNRLALGGTSSIGLLSSILDTPRRDPPGSAVLRRISRGLLRQRATSIADSLFLYYYDKGDLEIPGLLSTALGYGVRP
jgi:hypothetical protein